MDRDGGGGFLDLWHPLLSSEHSLVHHRECGHCFWPVVVSVCLCSALLPSKRGHVLPKRAHQGVMNQLGPLSLPGGLGALCRLAPGPSQQHQGPHVVPPGSERQGTKGWALVAFVPCSRYTDGVLPSTQSLPQYCPMSTSPGNSVKPPWKPVTFQQGPPLGGLTFMGFSPFLPPSLFIQQTLWSTFSNHRLCQASGSERRARFSAGAHFVTEKRRR